MPDGPRSTALDPDLLTSEIGLLLDHLSGRREPMTVARQQGQMPLGCATYDDALSRYFSIDEKVRRGENRFDSLHNACTSQIAGSPQGEG